MIEPVSKYFLTNVDDGAQNIIGLLNASEGFEGGEYFEKDKQVQINVKFLMIQRLLWDKTKNLLKHLKQE